MPQNISVIKINEGGKERGKSSSQNTLKGLSGPGLEKEDNRNIFLEQLVEIKCE